MNNQPTRTTQPLLPRALPVAGVFVAFTVLYVLTAQRGVGWQDSGLLQSRVLTSDYQGYSGLALAHPLYILIARGFASCFPASSRFTAINLCSGVGMATALAFLAALVGRLTASRRQVILAVTFLGLSHMAWWMATIAEVYTWALAALMAELYILSRYFPQRQGGWLVLLFAVNGLHLAIHNTAWLSLPVFLLLLPGFLRGRPLAVRLGWMVAAGAAWVAAAGPLLALVGREYVRTGEGLATLQSLLFGSGYQVRVLGLEAPIWRQTVANFALAGVSLLNPCWLLALPGLAECFAHSVDRISGSAGLMHGSCKDQHARPDCRALPAVMRLPLLALTVLHLLFWIRYFVPDQATFVLPTLGLLAVWAGIGGAPGASGKVPEGRTPAWWARGWWMPSQRRGGPIWLAVGMACAVCGPLVLRAVVATARIEINRSRRLPFRDEVRYWLLPWKQDERSAENFVQGVGRQLGAGDILVADATAAGPLLAARARGPRTESWRLITPWSGETDAELAALASQPPARLYVVSPVPGYAPAVLLAPERRAVREGLLWRLEGRE